MDKRNRRNLTIVQMLRNLIEVVFSFFVSIYLYKLVDGDMNFILGYVAFGVVLGIILSYFFLRIINSKNAKWILRLSFLAQVACVLILLILQENVLPVILVVRALDRLSSMAYYSVYETTLIRSSKKHNLSSFVAGVSMLSTCISMLAPAVAGYLITEYSYGVIFAVLVVVAVVAALFATRIDFEVVDKDFKVREFWRKARRRKNMRRAYGAMLLKRLSSGSGVLKYLLPITLFMALGTEFSVGSYNTLFSVVYIILMEVIRVFNRRKIRKRFYVPVALLGLASAITMMADFNAATILAFYFVQKTLISMVNTEMGSMVYAVGIKERLGNYTREHVFMWNVFLTIGHLMGILIAYVAYNYFYSVEVFGMIVVIFMVIYVWATWLLQKIEKSWR